MTDDLHLFTEDGTVTMTTYRRADGESTAGEFDWVTQLEWFEDDDEPTDLIKETWVRVASEPITVNPREPEEEEPDDE